MVACGVAAATYALLLTPRGLIVTPDGIAYLGIASNIGSGRGVTLPYIPSDTEVAPERAAGLKRAAPLFQYSPLYSVSIALVHEIGLELHDSARAINALGFAATAALVVASVLVLTSGSYLAASVAIALLLTTRSLILVYQGAATEAIFVPLCLAGLLVLASHVRAPSRRNTISFVLLGAASTLARVIGVALIGTAFLAVLLWHPGSRRQRLVHASWLSAASVLPLLVWRLIDDRAGLGGGPPLAFHPGPTVIGDVVNTMSQWASGSVSLAPSQYPFRRLVFFAACALGLVLAVASRLKRSNRPTRLAKSRGEGFFVRISVLFAAVYAVTLFATITFLDASVSFGGRYLLAVFPPALVCATVAAHRLMRRPRPRLRRAAVSAGAVALAVLIALWHRSSAWEIWSTRADQSATVAVLLHVPRTRVHLVAPRVPDVAKAVARLPNSLVVFTNLPEAIYSWTGRYAIALAPSRSVWTLEANSRQAAEFAVIAPTLCRHPGVVVVVGGAVGIFSWERTLRVGTELHVRQQFPDGVILAVDRARCAKARELS